MPQATCYTLRVIQGSVVATVDGSVGEIEQAWFQAVRQSSLPRVHEHILAQAGISLDRASVWLLKLLVDLDQPRLCDLAKRQGTDESTVSRQMKHCEQLGLVQRAADAADARAVRFSLTSAGRLALERIQGARHQLFESILQDWPESEKAHFARTLERFARDFQARLEENR